METFFETVDVARTLGLVADSIRYHEERGHIVPSARTLRGVRLYRERDVEVLRRHLEGRKRPA